MNKSVRPPAAMPSERATGLGFADRGDDIGEPDFQAIQQSPEFKVLRKRLLWFVFPMSAFFLCWYMTFVLFSAYDHEFMSRKLFGAVNIGTGFGLLQFVTTITIVLVYRRYAHKKLDPQVDRIHELAGVGKK
ncbi:MULTISPECIES: DUF485 domain-containing protein [Streptomyces]|uniref:Uncharacterized membrane protein (DUF485 family) n=2 Tax=Streptomyces TaxID=1883 RepID=A0ABT9L2H8_9ACTN|nr:MULTISPECIES: DUF485 domain-containing protein [Streptomyces]MBW8089868.1 DUF485 domain-containing protein [Streptomyces hygroscopicus subsp. hygroscopicus]MCO8302374.1 DUF485 domain-containing protein [Streptomyces sp. RKCA744]MDN3057854.1 DUF485 domain-containing protein [Streptomyces sp. SRF1]MDP9614920.1 uncharacterized membrane protein (DUF485 family) [Streptomyces demainii]GHJ32802.1 hypothetical protein TPA0910_72350 [Streptomyces hygroscopicus]